MSDRNGRKRSETVRNGPKLVSDRDPLRRTGSSRMSLFYRGPKRSKTRFPTLIASTVLAVHECVS
jgi:hypothetical protein